VQGVYPMALRGSITKGDINFSELQKLLNDDLTKWILKVLLEKPEGVNMAWIIDTYFRNNIHLYNRKERQKLYQRVYRRIRTLAKRDFVIIDSPKYSKYKIIKANARRLQNVINLIKSPTPCVSQTRKLIGKRDPEAILRANVDDPTLPTTISAKLKALQILIKNKELDDKLRSEIIDLFKDYIDDVTQKRIILIPKEEYRDELEPLILGYEVRFTSKRKAKRYKEQYRYIWEATAKNYRWGVVITLTIDPEKIQSIYEARYLAQEEFNRFMTWLKKFLKERARKYGKSGKVYPYVRFIEYQMNGRVHYHIVVFGTRWVKHENEIAQKYWRLGFVDVQTIVNVKGKWRFKKKPKDYDERYRRYRERKTGKATDGGSPLYASPDVYFYFSAGYSGIEDSSQLESFDDYDLLQMALHWALNTRFWTNSKDLQLPPNEKESLGLYEFYMTVYEFEIATILEQLLFDFKGGGWDEVSILWGGGGSRGSIYL
jgi:phage gpG-like protein